MTDATEPIDIFCDIIRGLSEEDAKEVMGITHLLAVGGTHADFFLPELANLRYRLVRLIEHDVSEQFLISARLDFLIDHFHTWTDSGSVEESIDVNLGLLEDLRADLLRPFEQRRRSLPDDELRDLIAKMQGVAARKERQRAQGLRILMHLEAAQESRLNRDYWRNWRRRRAMGG